MNAIQCVDCLKDGVTTKRPAPHGGPRSARCATHWRAWRKRSQSLAHARKVETTYGITSEEYWALFDAQGQRCYVCQRSNGTVKRLCVDHDHVTGEVRSLLCMPCNNIVLGRYGVEALQRAIEVLTDPPARKVLGRRVIVPNTEGA